MFTLIYTYVLGAVSYELFPFHVFKFSLTTPNVIGQTTNRCGKCRFISKTLLFRSSSNREMNGDSDILLLNESQEEPKMGPSKANKKKRLTFQKSEEKKPHSCCSVWCDGRDSITFKNEMKWNCEQKKKNSNEKKYHINRAYSVEQREYILRLLWNPSILNKYKALEYQRAPTRFRAHHSFISFCRRRKKNIQRKKPAHTFRMNASRILLLHLVISSALSKAWPKSSDTCRWARSFIINGIDVSHS